MKSIKLICAAVAAVAALVFAAPAGALVFTQPGGPYVTGAGDINSLAVGDVNGDGRDDVVTADYGPARFSVFLAGPSGGLAAPVAYSLPETMYSVALGDLDNDGDLDVIVAGNDTVAVSLGNGNGTFGAATGTPNPGYDGIAVEVGNFNSGGNLDVVVGDYVANRIGLMLGNGAGALVPQGTVATGSKPTGITVGDFDGDGIDDFATANYGSFFSGAITVALGSPSATFSPGPGSPLGGDFQPRDIADGDFDDDGNIDLGVVNSPNQLMSVKLGDGSGAFADAPSLPGIPSHWGESIGSADFDGDGFDDLAVTWTSSISGDQDNSIQVFLGSATGDMPASPDGPWHTTSPAYPWFLETGDFNDDGRPDFVTGDLGTRISVFINAFRELTADPTTIDFGDRAIGTGPSTSQSADFTNTGTATVTVAEGGVSLTGSHADQFQIVSEDCDEAAISPAGDCSVTVAFNPTSVGPKSASLEVVSDAENGPTAVALSGTGITVPKAAIDPVSHDFGNVPLGTGPSSAKQFTVESTGSETLSISSIQLAGSDASAFDIVTNDCPPTLEPEATCQVGVDFEPAATGPASATLQVASNDADSPAEAALTGTGAINPGFSVDPASHDFGNVAVGSSATPQTFTVESTGTTPLEISDVDIDGSFADQYDIVSDDCEGSTLAPEDTCEVELNFLPTSIGPKADVLSFATNLTPQSQDVAITGTGMANPAIDITPTAGLDFGQVALNTGPTAAQTFTVESTGTTPLENIAVSLVGSDLADFSIVSTTCGGQSLPPEGTCLVSIDFEPGALGERTAGLRVQFEGGSAERDLAGEGTANPNFTLTPATHDFGTRITGEGPGAPQAFTVTSTGTTDLETGQVSLTGAAADQFQITSDSCSNQTLAPNATCEIGVAFAPTTAGEKVAELSVAVQGWTGPPIGLPTAWLTGSGQNPIPPPDPCEPVAVKKIAYFTPKVKKRSNIPGVRARITTAGPAVVRVSSKVIYHLNGRQGTIRYKQRQFRVASDSVNYKVAIPKKLRKKLRPKKQIRFVITYSSKAVSAQCKKFGSKKTRNLTTRIVWVIPNA